MDHRHYFVTSVLHNMCTCAQHEIIFHFENFSFLWTDVFLPFVGHKNLRLLHVLGVIQCRLLTSRRHGHFDICCSCHILRESIGRLVFCGRQLFFRAPTLLSGGNFSLGRQFFFRAPRALKRYVHVEKEALAVTLLRRQGNQKMACTTYVFENISSAAQHSLEI